MSKRATVIYTDKQTGEHWHHIIDVPAMTDRLGQINQVTASLWSRLNEEYAGDLGDYKSIYERFDVIAVAVNLDTDHDLIMHS